MACILILEQDRKLRSRYKAALETAGHQVHAPRKAHQALDILRKKRCDLIVMEIFAEGYNGFDLLSDILRERRQIRIIVNTEHPELKTDFRLWAADKLLLKNGSGERLMRAVDEIISLM